MVWGLGFEVGGMGFGVWVLPPELFLQLSLYQRNRGCHARSQGGNLLRVTCYLLRVTCYVLRVTCYVLRVTCYVLHYVLHVFSDNVLD